MVRGNGTAFSLLSFSALFYLVLLFSPLALVGTVQAQSDQEPLAESYGTGMSASVAESELKLIDVCSYWYRSWNYVRPGSQTPSLPLLHGYMCSFVLKCAN